MILINSSAKSSSFEKRVVGALNHSVAVVSSAETPSGESRMGSLPLEIVLKSSLFLQLVVETT